MGCFSYFLFLVVGEGGVPSGLYLIWANLAERQILSGSPERRFTSGGASSLSSAALTRNLSQPQLAVSCFPAKSVHHFHPHWLLSGEEVSVSSPDSSTSQCQASQQPCHMTSASEGEVLRPRGAVRQHQGDIQPRPKCQPSLLRLNSVAALLLPSTSQRRLASDHSQAATSAVASQSDAWALSFLHPLKLRLGLEGLESQLLSTRSVLIIKLCRISAAEVIRDWLMGCSRHVFIR